MRMAKHRRILNNNENETQTINLYDESKTLALPFLPVRSHRNGSRTSLPEMPEGNFAVSLQWEASDRKEVRQVRQACFAMSL